MRGNIAPHSYFVIDTSQLAAAAILATDGTTSMGTGVGLTKNAGAGDYTITISPGIAAEECVESFGIRGAAGDVRVATIVHTSDTVKELLVVDEAVAAADAIVSVKLDRITRRLS